MICVPWCIASIFVFIIFPCIEECLKCVLLSYVFLCYQSKAKSQKKAEAKSHHWRRWAVFFWFLMEIIWLWRNIFHLGVKHLCVLWCHAYSLVFICFFVENCWLLGYGHYNGSSACSILLPVSKKGVHYHLYPWLEK